jgi:hypothetical protein
MHCWRHSQRPLRPAAASPLPAAPPLLPRGGGSCRPAASYIHTSMCQLVLSTLYVLLCSTNGNARLACRGWIQPPPTHQGATSVRQPTARFQCLGQGPPTSSPDCSHDVLQWGSQLSARVLRSRGQGGNNTAHKDSQIVSNPLQRHPPPPTSTGPSSWHHIAGVAYLKHAPCPSLARSHVRHAPTMCVIETRHARSPLDWIQGTSHGGTS